MTSHIQPTTEQWEQSGIAQAEAIELFDRLTTEGIDWRVVLSGFTGAMANAVMMNVGADEVPVFFARTAAQTMHLAKPG